jgi:Spy/CpxP family protein refolding chaperone
MTFSLKIMSRALATLLSKFRIKASDVIIIPDVMRKADNETREEFKALIDGQGIDERELNAQKERTNR